MSNTLIELIGDYNIPPDVFNQLLDALDREKSPKVRDVKVDYDGIKNSHLLDLIGATQCTSLASLHMAFTDLDASFARNLLESADVNRNIAECWFLLGQHQFYYRTGVMVDANMMIQLYHNPRNVTIECEKLDDKQADDLINILLRSNSLHLNLKVTDMDEDKARAFAFRLQSEHSPFETLKLQLGATTITVEPLEEEADLVQQFSTLMQSVRTDVAELSAATSGIASSLFQQGRTWLSSFSNPITACASAPVMDDLLDEQPPTPDLNKKERLGKLA